ncbi:MAG TPA: sulfatase [Candidatus Limnocylindrales bacterium]|nr:sulfatase [Candidatus Limnocylindrales bacterium]
MTAAAVVFCCLIALAIGDGFGAAAFATVVASDALHAALPFIGILIAARFALRRLPARAALVHRLHASVQALIATMSFGWIWLEPHSMLTSHTGGSLAAMGWLAVAGGTLGLVFALISERSKNPPVMRELSIGSWVFLLLVGGRIYRAFDHIEAGTRLAACIGVVGATFAATLAVWLLLRNRQRLATAIPALAPAVAAIALLAASRSGGGPSSPAPRESILLIVVDTLRADIADGHFESETGTMPQLARIAAQGVRFTQAVSPAPWTLPATVSLLSGWNPHRHGFGRTASDWEVLRGNPDALYLAPALRQAGYLTSAFLNNPYLRPWFGFGPGFYLMRPYHGRAVDGAALALDWLHGHIASPSFMLLHLMDPHWPYDAPPGFGAARQPCSACDSLFATQYENLDAAARAEVERRYAAEVQYTDGMLGLFYDTLDRGGALEHTWLIVTSDHGEEFWEHGGFMHGHSLFDELLRVPLVVVPPKSRGDAKRAIRIDTQVRLEDVGATILDIAGIDAGKAPDGRSLLSLVSDAPDIAPRPSVAGYVKSPTELAWSVRRPPWKIVKSPVLAANRLFNLASDPGETANLLFNPRMPDDERAAASQAYFSLAGEARRMGLEVNRKPAASELTSPESDTRDQLRSLGYAH